jgi:hypothetical protein
MWEGLSWVRLGASSRLSWRGIVKCRNASRRLCAGVSLQRSSAITLVYIWSSADNPHQQGQLRELCAANLLIPSSYLLHQLPLQKRCLSVCETSFMYSYFVRAISGVSMSKLAGEEISLIQIRGPVLSFVTEEFDRVHMAQKVCRCQSTLSCQHHS